MCKNILFIGGSGFIGSNLIIKLLSKSIKEWQIHVLEPSSANTSRLQGLDVKIHKGSLSDFDYVRNLVSSMKIRTIVHLVSTMVPGSTYEDYQLEFKNVIFPTFRLMQLCSNRGIKFIFFSSGGTVYGERKCAVPFLESDPKEPISYYGLSKQIIENSLLFEHRTSGLEYLVLRPSNPYGTGQNLYGKQGLIAVALGRVFANLPITVWGEGNSVRDYIYVDDLAEIFCQLLSKGISNEVINIGSGVGVSINNIIDTLREILDEDIKVEYERARKTDVSSMILDISKLKSILPDFHFTELKVGINLFYQYEKSKLNGKWR